MTKRNIHVEIAEKLIALIEREGTNWTKPWACSAPHQNARTGHTYRGINTFLTAISAATSGFESTHWNTYKGWSDMGHQVAKGSRSTSIVFWGQFKTGEGEDAKTVPFAKFYAVFNASQLAEPYQPANPVTAPTGSETVENADNLIDATGAQINYGGDRAMYVPSEDIILLPKRADFYSTDGFYGAAFHELGHWTGHKSRLDRGLKSWVHSHSAYAFEELIAEITAAFLCGQTGVSPEPRPDHARYINSWLKGIRDKPNSVTRAFSAAQKAADFINARPEWKREAA